MILTHEQDGLFMYQVYHHFLMAKNPNLMMKSAFNSITNHIAFNYKKQSSLD